MSKKSKTCKLMIFFIIVKNNKNKVIPRTLEVNSRGQNVKKPICNKSKIFYQRAIFPKIFSNLNYNQQNLKWRNFLLILWWYTMRSNYFWGIIRIVNLMHLQFHKLYGKILKKCSEAPSITDGVHRNENFVEIILVFSTFSNFFKKKNIYI